MKGDSDDIDFEVGPTTSRQLRERRLDRDSDDWKSRYCDRRSPEGPRELNFD